MPEGHAEVGVVSGESQLEIRSGEWFRTKCGRFRKPKRPRARPSASGVRSRFKRPSCPSQAPPAASLAGRRRTPRTNRYPRSDGKVQPPVSRPAPCRWSRFLSILTERHEESKENPLDKLNFGKNSSERSNVPSSKTIGEPLNRPDDREGLPRESRGFPGATGPG